MCKFKGQRKGLALFKNFPGCRSKTLFTINDLEECKVDSCVSLRVSVRGWPFFICIKSSHLASYLYYNILAHYCLSL